MAVRHSLEHFLARLTVGVLRCVLDRIMSRNSVAVGTGAIALRPPAVMLDIVEGRRRASRPSKFYKHAHFPTVKE